MTVNLYQTGVSALNAAQQQLATTGHNIANVNTEGYSRQRVEQNSQLGQTYGGNYIGNGTYVSDITRIFDEFAYREQTITANQSSYSTKFNDKMTQLDSTMSTYGTSISNSINSYYSSLHTIADSPNDLTLRDMSLAQANSLVNDFHSMRSAFDSMEQSNAVEIEEIANRVTTISHEIASINEQIQGINSTNLGDANDLLDHRDILVNELNEYTTVNTLEDGNGVMTVMIGSGATLVAGTTALSMSVQIGRADPNDTTIILTGANGTFGLKTESVGGELGAMLAFREGELTRASNEMDLIAMGIASTINDSQSKGLDLDGLNGLEVFNDINESYDMEARVFSDRANTGTLQAQVRISDIGALTADEYSLDFDGVNYKLTNLSTGEITDPLPLTAPGVYGTSDGFQFEELSGAASAGDTFILKPVQNGANNFSVALSDSSKIAASSAVSVTANETNISSGSVSISNVYDPEGARTLAGTTYPSVTVDVWESASGVFDYRVFDSSNPPPAAPLSSGSYTAGNSATVDLPPLPSTAVFQIEISGVHKGEGTDARETFIIENAFGESNGNNMLDMADTQNEKALAGGNSTFEQFLSSNISSVGSVAASSETIALTQFALSEQAQSRHQSVSGVNLDEEAANMLQFQQAYQASAKIIDVANTIFDTILASVR